MNQHLRTAQKSITLLGVMLLVPVTGLTQTLVNAPTCDSLSYSRGPIIVPHSNTNDHFDGSHGSNAYFNEKCTYSGGTQSTVHVPCTARSVTTPVEYPWENGNTIYYAHAPFTKVQDGGQTGAAGGTAASDGEGAISVTGCTFPGCATVGITIAGPGNNTGFNVTFGTAPHVLEEDKAHDQIICNAYTLSAYAVAGCPVPNGPPPGVMQGFVAVWSSATCSWQIVPSGESPIAIDTKGSDWKGNLFTDARKGDYILFDLHGDGHSLKLSWPRPESGIAWLVLPDADGNVTNGSQLFGNYSPHANADFTPTPNDHDPNGFLALAYYDQLQQGGNGNSLIDKGDPVFAKLRLWFPKHCFDDKDSACHSLPGELVPLASEGITSISLVYDGPADIVDKVGNQYRWWSYLNPDAEQIKKNARGESCCDLHRTSKDGRKAIDVYLMAIP